MSKWRTTLMKSLAPVWSAEARVHAVRHAMGMGLGRLAMAALLLALTLTSLMWVDLQAMLAEAPGVIRQLPALALKGGELVATPSQVAPLILHNSQGKEIAILDLAGRTRLENRAAFVMVTKSRVLVKAGDGSVQAFPLGTGGQPDQSFTQQELLAGVKGIRWLALLIFLPLFYLFALAMLGVEFGLLGLLALVPNLIYRLGLDAAGRLRLASLGLIPSTTLVALCLVAGWHQGLSLIAMGCSLLWVLLGSMSLDAWPEPEDESCGTDPGQGKEDENRP